MPEPNNTQAAGPIRPRYTPRLRRRRRNRNSLSEQAHAYRRRVQRAVRENLPSVFQRHNRGLVTRNEMIRTMLAWAWMCTFGHVSRLRQEVLTQLRRFSPNVSFIPREEVVREEIRGRPNENVNSEEEEFLCPVCKAVEPICTTVCGHRFCGACPAIVVRISSQRRCPECRGNMNHLIPLPGHFWSEIDQLPSVNVLEDLDFEPASPQGAGIRDDAGNQPASSPQVQREEDENVVRPTPAGMSMWRRAPRAPPVEINANEGEEMQVIHRDRQLTRRVFPNDLENLYNRIEVGTLQIDSYFSPSIMDRCVKCDFCGDNVMNFEAYLYGHLSRYHYYEVLQLHAIALRNMQQ